MTSTSRMGRFMVYLSWIMAVALLTWLFTGLLDRQRNPNLDVETRVGAGAVKEVVLKRNRSGHYIASGRINGHPVEFLLDTGASDVSVPLLVAQRMNLKFGAPVRMQTANGVVTAYAATLDSVKLGKIELRRVRASVMPNSGIEGVLLGMAFLQHLELIQRGDTLTIRQ